LRCGRNFHEVKICILCHLHRFTKRFDASLLTVFVYQSNLGSGDLSIDSGVFIGYVNNSC
jgi:hypothetical protein